MSSNNGDWQSSAFRQKVILNIDDALKKSANIIGSQNEISAAEIEDQIFGRSTSRDNYIRMVARIILHLQQESQNQPQPAPTMNQGPTTLMVPSTNIQQSGQMMVPDPNAKMQNDEDVANKDSKNLTILKRLLSILIGKERVSYHALLEVEDVLRRVMPTVSPQKTLGTMLPRKRPINIVHAETSEKRIRVDGKTATGNRKEMTNFPQKLSCTRNVDFKRKRPINIVHAETSEKRIRVDGKTATGNRIKRTNFPPKLSRTRNVDFKTKHATVVANGGMVASGASTMNLPYHSMTVVNDKEIKMALGSRITVVVGDVAQEKVDVIVNTTNDKVDLNVNPCGKALLKVAGEELLNECQKIGSLTTGDIASTGPAKLNCKRVYHVRSSSWDNGKGALILRTLIKKCLDQMEKDKLRSIAIPAIGTGALHFPRLEVAKIFFEEVTGYLTAHPQLPIEEVHFVAFDQATVDAFLGAVQEIKSVMLSSPSKRVPVPLPERKVIPNAFNAGSPNNVTFTEKPDGSLELSLGTTNLTVQIVWADIKNESTDLIMHVIRQDSSFQGGVCKAFIRAGGDSIVQEFKALGQPALYSTQYTKAGRLAVHQIAHVTAPASIEVADLKKCVDTFFDDVLKKNIARVSFCATGVDAMGYFESQSADLIFDNLSRIAELKNPALSLVRIVICEKAKFIKFKDATKAYFASRVVTRSRPPIEGKFHKFNLSTSSKEYQDVETTFHKTVSNQIVRIERIQNKEICELYNVKRTAMMKKYGSKFNLSTSSKEYQDVETAFHKTVSNPIVRIERIQNKEICELYNVKRTAMMKKYGSNFVGKELWLFHGTSRQNIDKINANGLNRSYAGTHATCYGKGVYFARHASYSCRRTYSPPDLQGLRYMYYAKVLVGDYTRGNSSMIARPNKNTADPDETYDSVVDNISNPNIYILFQDYEYFTEYLITFR